MKITKYNIYKINQFSTEIKNPSEAGKSVRVSLENGDNTGAYF